MFKFLKRILGIIPDYSERHVNLDRLPPPSKKAIRRRERKAAEQIALMKTRKIYLNVPFKSAEPAPPSNVTKIRKTA